MTNKTNRTHKPRGFTLIETLVAVLLLVSAIAGPLTIASKGLLASISARDQMVAFYLAQDAVEYVRWVRDSNKLQAKPWLTGLSACTGTDGCTIDTLPGTVAACSGACSMLNKQTSSGSTFFTYSGGTPTPQQFTRTVKLADAAGAPAGEKVLTVSVSWRQQSGVVRTIVVRENIFDWQ